MAFITLSPDQNALSNFRRDKPKAVKEVCRDTVKMAEHFNLRGGKRVAGNSTKLHAQNSKKNTFNPKKIERHITYIDQKIEGYNKELAWADGDRREGIMKEVQKQSQRKVDYTSMKEQALISDSCLPLII